MVTVPSEIDANAPDRCKVCFLTVEGYSEAWSTDTMVTDSSDECIL